MLNQIVCSDGYVAEVHLAVGRRSGTLDRRPVQHIMSINILRWLRRCCLTIGSLVQVELCTWQRRTILIHLCDGQRSGAALIGYAEVNLLGIVRIRHDLSLATVYHGGIAYIIVAISVIRILG